MNLTIRIGSLMLKNPVAVASGTAGYGEELARYMEIGRLGAVFTKGLSLEPRPGNRGNRIIETPAGVLNSIGLENVGLERFVNEKLPFLREKGATVIPNIAGHSIEENITLCRELSAAEGVAALELNVSCPNVKEGGMAFGTDMAVFTRLLEKCRPACAVPLIVKLSPNVTDIASFAVRAEACGADAVSAVNTFLGMKIDVSGRRPHFDNLFAGLSGPAIRPLAVRAVYQICSAVRIPVIGIGGIASLMDALEFIMAGASAIAVGTMNMVEPASAASILDDLEEYLNAEGIDDIQEIIGCARHDRNTRVPQGCSGV